MKLIAAAIPVLLLIVGVVSIYVWLTADAGRAYEVRLPGRDGTPAPGAQVDEPIKITGQLTKFDGVPADLPGSWPRFRGADFDAISKENIEPAATWSEKGPAQEGSMSLTTTRRNRPIRFAACRWPTERTSGAILIP